jgi:hypothetical protein
MPEEISVQTLHDAYMLLRDLIDHLADGKIFAGVRPLPPDAWFDQPETVQLRWAADRLEKIRRLRLYHDRLGSLRESTFQAFASND